MAKYKKKVVKKKPSRTKTKLVPSKIPGVDLDVVVKRKPAKKIIKKKPKKKKSKIYNGGTFPPIIITRKPKRETFELDDTGDKASYEEDLINKKYKKGTKAWENAMREFHGIERKIPKSTKAGRARTEINTPRGTRIGVRTGNSELSRLFRATNKRKKGLVKRYNK